jgi:hypothetical protein
MKDALRLSQGSRSLLSLLDYNQDPRLDNQLAVKKCAKKGKWVLLESKIRVPPMAAANDKLKLMKRVIKFSNLTLGSINCVLDGGQ